MLNNIVLGAIVTLTDHRGCTETSTYVGGAEGAQSARDDWDPFYGIPHGRGSRGTIQPSQIACEARFWDAREISPMMTLYGASCVLVQFE